MTPKTTLPPKTTQELEEGASATWTEYCAALDALPKLREQYSSTVVKEATINLDRAAHHLAGRASEFSKCAQAVVSNDTTKKVVAALQQALQAWNAASSRLDDSKMTYRASADQLKAGEKVLNSTMVRWNSAQRDLDKRLSLLIRQSRERRMEIEIREKSLEVVILDDDEDAGGTEDVAETSDSTEYVAEGEEEDEAIMSPVEAAAWPMTVGRICMNTTSTEALESLKKHTQKKGFTLDLVGCGCSSRCDEKCSNVIEETMCEASTCSIMQRNETCDRYVEVSDVESVTTGHEKIVLVKESGDCGTYGVKAKAHISAGESIIEYVGHVLTQNEWNGDETYAMELSRDMQPVLYVDAAKAGNLSRFINHTCDSTCANVMFKLLPFGVSWRIFVVAMCDIEIGATILVEYTNSSARCVGGTSDVPVAPPAKATKRKPEQQKPAPKKQQKKMK